jgi:hypothetical protein
MRHGPSPSSTCSVSRTRQHRQLALYNTMIPLVHMLGCFLFMAVFWNATLAGPVETDSAPGILEFNDVTLFMVDCWCVKHTAT